MPFDSGSITFRRFAVVGNKQPKSITQDHLDALFEFALKEKDLAAREETEYGWSGGRHILDTHFSFENNVFADCLHCALRIDTNKFPSELKHAYLIQEEESAAKKNPSGFISKMQKRDAKDLVRRKIEDELRAGHFRRSKLLPILWDLPGSTIYSAASGKSFEMLAEIFERTFNLSLQPLSAGSLALRLLSRARDGSYRAVGFLDDDPGKRYRRLGGVPIVGTVADLEAAIARYRVDVVLYANEWSGVEDLAGLREKSARLGAEWREFAAPTSAVRGAPPP